MHLHTYMRAQAQMNIHKLHVPGSPKFRILNIKNPGIEIFADIGPCLLNILLDPTDLGSCTEEMTPDL